VYIETNLFNTNKNECLNKDFFFELSLHNFKNIYTNDAVVKGYDFAEKLCYIVQEKKYFCRYIGIKWHKDNTKTFSVPQKNNYYKYFVPEKLRTKTQDEFHFHGINNYNKRKFIVHNKYK